MGTVFKKTFTKPLPPNAEVFEKDGERFARWKPAKGRQRIVPLTKGTEGTGRILIKAATYTAKYRDGQGRVCERPTGCRDETAARSVLARALIVLGQHHLIERADGAHLGGAHFVLAAHLGERL